jgi:hypothetical protein
MRKPISQTVKNQPLLPSSGECTNANYENKNVQSRSDEEEKMLHSATQKPLNEDVIFNIHDKAHYFRYYYQVYFYPYRH